MLSSSKSSGFAQRIGELYWEIDLELIDPTPVAIERLIPLLLSNRMIGHGHRGKLKLELEGKGKDSSPLSDDSDDDYETPETKDPVVPERKEAPSPITYGAGAGAPPTLSDVPLSRLTSLTSLKERAGLLTPGVKIEKSR